MKKGVLAFGVSIALIGISASYAATPPTGKTIVRIEDGAASRCINSSTDRITMNLRRVIIEKKSKWLSEEQSVALVLNTTISGNDSNSIAKKVSFPRMYTALTKNYSDGLISVPIEEKLFSNFALFDAADNSYDSTEIEFSLLAFRVKDNMGAALTSLSNITNSMPIPINPFSEGFKFFGAYATSVVDAAIKEDNNIAATAKEGKIVLSFSPNAICTGDQERTGTLAVVSGISGSESKGVVDITKEYCWKANLTPVFTLKYASLPANNVCTDVNTASYKVLNNPYIAFYLNAEPKKPSLSATPSTFVMYPPAIEPAKVSLTSANLNKAIRANYSMPKKGVSYLSNKVQIDLNKGNSEWHDLDINPLGQVQITTTAADSVAFDITESLKRCAAHGVEASMCI
jgi:hypothetical protein